MATPFSVIGPKQGGTDQTIWDLQVDAQGRMWAGTNGDGAFRFDGTNVRRYTTHDGLASNFIWQILGDSRGHVWLFGNNGIDRFTGDELTHYGRGDGLIDLEGTASASFEDREGNLWFGTGAGLLRYSEGLGVVKPIVPPIFIEETTHDGDTIAPVASNKPTRLRRGVVRIRFSSPTFRDESAVYFRYRLVRHERRMVGADVRSNASPTRGLRRASYRFEVIAMNGAVPSAAPASFAFDILPPFWQTWWFRSLGALVLLGAAAAVPLVPRADRSNASVDDCRRSSRGTRTSWPRRTCGSRTRTAISSTSRTSRRTTCRSR